MADWVLSKSSKARLEGLDERLVAVVKRCLSISPVDFGVAEGLRTEARQRELVQRGASKTMHSKHLVGKAVDLFVYVDGRACWEVHAYFGLVDAMAQASREVGVVLRWGGCWGIIQHMMNPQDVEANYEEYLQGRVEEGKKAFVDAPHFEIYEQV